MAMWNPGITRANAQPPGGRSSIMFNDGSDTRLRHSRPMGGLGEGYFGGHIHRTAPGGQSSIVFDDTISRRNDVSSDEGRHTNGLRRIIQQPQQQQPDCAPQPPGGRSSFSLSDASHFDYQPHHRQQHQHQHQHQHQRQQVSQGGDALDDLVRTATHAAPLSHAARENYAPTSVGGDGFRDDVTGGSRRAQLAPPGGRSTFSIGWGQDQGNHHHAYLGKVPLPAVGGGANGHGQGLGHLFGSGNAPQRPTHFGDDPARPTDRGGYMSMGSSGNQKPSFAAAFAEKAPQPPGSVTGFAGVHANGRVSTTVLQPPGGASTFAFG